VIFYTFVNLGIIVLWHIGAKVYFNTLFEMDKRTYAINYDPDIVVSFFLMWLSVTFIMAYVLIIFDKISLLRSKYMKGCALASVFLALLTPFLAHGYLTHAFAEAGYVKCGLFHATPEVDKRKSIFSKRAWVLDPADCPGAGARLPPPGA
jgi:hypothetical protein